MTSLRNLATYPHGSEPRKIAEWEKIMQKYEFLDEEDEAEASQEQSRD